jgi:hypothetical protein
MIGTHADHDKSPAAAGLLFSGKGFFECGSGFPAAI